MPDLELVKKYLRIDGSEDDDVLTLLLSAAKEYLRNAGVPEPSVGEDSKLYDLAVMLRVNREKANDDKEAERIDRSLLSIILQLKSYGEG